MCTGQKLIMFGISRWLYSLRERKKNTQLLLNPCPTAFTCIEYFTQLNRAFGRML